MAVFLIEFSSGNEKKKVVARVNGKKTEVIINRKFELEVFQKLHVAFGTSKLHCTFGNGIVYDFKEGRTLSGEEIRGEHQEGCAKMTARLHKSSVEVSDKRIVIVDNLKRWFEEFCTYTYSGGKKAKIEKTVNTKNIGEEIDKIVKMLKVWDDTITFCHNDLLGGNIVFNKSSNSYNVVDFEYSGYNYRGYDIGDHIAEYLGLELSDYVITREDIERFCKFYLQEFHGKSTVDKQELDILVSESFVGMVLSHLMWGLWAFIQAKNSEISFDYFNYGLSRIDMYKEKKDEMFKILEKFQG